MLLPTEGSSLRRSLDQWFDAEGLRPRVVGEIEDSALLKVFGQAGVGLFPAPVAIEAEVRAQFGVKLVGRVDAVKERFYALSAERKLKHPAVVAISRGGAPEALRLAGARIRANEVSPMAESGVRIGVLRGRENSFPDAFIAKVNSMGKGVTAEFVHLGGTKLNEPVPYRVILDRMSHEVPYYSVYLKMAALQGTYCINNIFWRTADDKFFGYAAAEKLGIAEPKTVVLPNRSYVDDVTAESLRNLWPTDFSMYLDYVGCPCIMKPAFGGGWKNVNKIHSLDELLHHYNESGTLTMMLQEFISWDTYIRVPTIGRRWARAIRYDPAPGGMGGYNQDYDILPKALRDKAEELSLQYNVALGYDMNALEFAVKDGKFYGIDLTNYTPDLDYRSLKDAHFPWAVEKMATFAIEKALSKEGTPAAPDWKSLLLK